MSEYQVLFEGAPVDKDFYEQISRLEVEENADLPGAISLTLPVGVVDEELTWVSDARLRPYANVAVVATAPDAADECIFDGYVLTHKVHLPSGTAGATVEVWGQDATVLMGMTEHVKVWSGMTEADVAEQIFSSYGIAAASANGTQPGPTHSDDEHALVQRGSDAEFLRRLARRTGRWFRVFAGEKAGARSGWFAPPGTDAEPVVTIGVTDPATSAVPVLDFSWDASRPTAVEARQVSLADNDKTGVSAATSASGLSPLDARTLADFAGKERTVLLTAAADTTELPDRSAGLLRESNWFVRCEGTTDVNVLKRVLRVGQVVAVEGCGSLLSGRYLVWSVRHTFTTQAHAMSFALVSNTVGPEA
ncbi:contractile injection system protein, VgrG/Pvc8 family [Microbacterium sp. BK668]|uniref:phage late control D family protein n=1 Tax=Microbacterium sp. BK668 TaxID=2512118 RepID=UPI0010EB74E6|nr:contractile injection system protein, VgrG/Pvc8 family [Microbacterium sp. BK668]TDN90908.1 phage protein D [Microbacterium sp. BK668]